MMQLDPAHQPSPPSRASSDITARTPGRGEEAVGHESRSAAIRLLWRVKVDAEELIPMFAERGLVEFGQGPEAMWAGE